MKKAKGYIASDTVEEYTKDEENGEMVLKKRKVSKKHIPPDVAAIKLLLSFTDGENGKLFEELSDEELLKMRRELIERLESSEEVGSDNAD